MFSISIAFSNPRKIENFQPFVKVINPTFQGQNQRVLQPSKNWEFPAFCQGHQSNLPRSKSTRSPTLEKLKISSLFVKVISPTFQGQIQRVLQPSKNWEFRAFSTTSSVQPSKGVSPTRSQSSKNWTNFELFVKVINPESVQPSKVKFNAFSTLKKLNKIRAFCQSYQIYTHLSV